MSTFICCPKCGDPVTSQQIEGRRRYYCNHCGGLPYHDGKPETGRGHIHSRAAIDPAVSPNQDTTGAVA